MEENSDNKTADIIEFPSLKSESPWKSSHKGLVGVSSKLVDMMLELPNPESGVVIIRDKDNNIHMATNCVFTDTHLNNLVLQALQIFNQISIVGNLVVENKVHTVENIFVEEVE